MSAPDSDRPDSDRADTDRADTDRADTDRADTDRRDVRVRRSPRIGSFATTGVVAGLIATLILTFAFPENPEFPRSQVFGFLLLIFATIGAVLGAVVALVLDRASSRRARTVAAERERGIPEQQAPLGAPESETGAGSDASPPRA